MNVATLSPLPYEPAVTVVLAILNSLPFNANPVPAVYVPAPENCTQTTGLVPTVVTGSGITQPVLSYRVPAVTNVKSPPAISVGVLKSSARVNTVLLVRTYIPLCAVFASFLTRIRMSFANVTPSIVVYVPVVVNVAPTPDVPLLYVIVPPEIVANVVDVAALQLS